MHGTPRQRRRQQRLDDLVEAGLALLATHGLDGLTVARLAEEVDLTPGALYRYFPSKDALLAALLARVLEDWGAALHQVITGPPEADPPPSALQAPITALLLYVRLARARPLHFGLLASTLADPRVLVTDPADAVHVPALRDLLRRIGSSLHAALPGATDADAATLVLGLTGVLCARKLRRFDPLFDPTSLAERSIATHLIGLGATPADVDQAMAAARARIERAWPEGDPR